MWVPNLEVKGMSSLASEVLGGGVWRAMEGEQMPLGW